MPRELRGFGRRAGIRKVRRAFSEISENQTEGCKTLCYFSVSGTNELINTFSYLLAIHTTMTCVKEFAQRQSV